MNELEQKEVDHIRQNATRYGTSGGGNFENPKTRDDKRTRKLLDNGILLYVGVGKRTENGWTGGAGLIPADMFDETKHSKLSVDQQSKVTVQAVNEAFNVVLDNQIIAQCKDSYWANYLANAIKRER